MCVFSWSYCSAGGDRACRGTRGASLLQFADHFSLPLAQHRVYLPGEVQHRCLASLALRRLRARQRCSPPKYRSRRLGGFGQRVEHVSD